ncbi:hypothetical protein BGI41_04315 [Methanobrevibacter sp. 87.7]|uniref:hypothetical protein n=1 Tax=Methanobrevibacter sp. 87.7 TaxID=387957 RepID=UPI000B50AAC0|nr:hypothetical protein [Methanobrevibacter sp. 87.7]OWT33068.1 hypothetical protein BGI41_04315 [Methanobrevibacter sp. 87.7]
MKNYNKFILLGLFIIVIVCLTNVSAVDSSMVANNSQLSSNLDNELSTNYQISSNSNLSTNYQVSNNTDSDVSTDYPVSSNNLDNKLSDNNLEYNTNTEIIVNDSSLVGNQVYINTSISSDGKLINLGNATIYVIGNNRTISHTANINNNSFIWTPKNPGIYNITIVYNGGKFGNITYLKSNSTKYNFIVDSIDLSVDNITVYYTDKSKLTGKVYSNGKALANHTVIFNILGRNYTATTDENGEASIPIELNPGKYNIYTYIPRTSISVNSTVNVVVNKSLIHIIVSDLNKDFRDSKKYSVKLLYDNIPITNTNVVISLLNVKYNVKTNNQGIGYLTVNLNPGKYKFTVNSNVYGYNVSNSSNVIVNKWIKSKTSLVVSKLTKNYLDAAYTAKVLYKNNPISGIKVFFTIKGKTYSRITNSKGIATFNINLGVGTYAITSKINTAGVSLSKKSSIKIIKANPSLYFKNVDMEYSLVNNTPVLKYSIKKGKTVVIGLSYKNKPLSAYKVTIGINSFKNYKWYKTNSKGLINYPTSNLKIGKNSFVITLYSSNKNYNSLRWNIPITIKK